MSWRTNGTRVEDSDGRLVAYLTPWSTEADARKIAAVEDLIAALWETSRALSAVVSDMTVEELENYQRTLLKAQVNGEGLFTRAATALALAEGT